MNRRGVTILEVLIVVAILGLLVGLTLAAVQKVRSAGMRTQNANNLRQIALGMHTLFAKGDGGLTELLKSDMSQESLVGTRSLFFRLLPIVHREPVYTDGMSAAQVNENFRPNISVYRNPGDPSYEYGEFFEGRYGKCSYAMNVFAMNGAVDLTSSIPDGTSATLMTVDKYYAWCEATGGRSGYLVRVTWHDYSELENPRKTKPYGARRATFADAGWGDVVPTTDPMTHTTRPSILGKMFQVAPRPELVDPTIPSTPFTAGLTAAFFDGSVRTIAPGVDPGAFWAAVTPAGGEVVSLD